MIVRQRANERLTAKAQMSGLYFLCDLASRKSFVMGMMGDTSDALIVRSTIDLAHNLGLSVAAEGVEDEATLEGLCALGCDVVQGYLLSRPLEANELAAWMRGSTWTRAVREVTRLRRVV